ILSYLFTSTRSILFFFLYLSPPPVIYTLSLHDALPIFVVGDQHADPAMPQPRHDRLNVVHGDRVHAREGLVEQHELGLGDEGPRDRKSTRLNSSHVAISYAVFCLKKKNRRKTDQRRCRG